MRQFFILLLGLVLLSSVSYAADFTPTVLKLKAPSAIHYDFDGSELSIPVTVTGTPAGTIFFVYTKGMADQIVGIRNGYLGWHHVNKVDTMVYMSDLQQLDIGSTTIEWDGKNADGNAVATGEYTYYLWAFDNVSQKVKASDSIGIGYNDLNLEEYGVDGGPLSRPLLHQYNSRWLIGNDPLDSGLLETSSFEFPEGFGRERMQALHPQDWSIVYVGVKNSDAKSTGVMKYEWVPNGSAVRDQGWGQDEGATLFSKADSHGYPSGVITDGTYLYKIECHVFAEVPDAPLDILDFDGTLIEEVQMTDVWTKADDYEAGEGEYLNGGPEQIDERNGLLFMSAYYTCMKHCVDPKRYLDSGDYDDLTVWVNENGDNINDRNFEEDAEKPWACFGGGAPHFYSIHPDANNFVSCPQYDLGAVSFSIMAPDGFGVGHFAYAGETAGPKQGAVYVCYNSAYDGCYTDNKSSSDDNLKGGLWFVGHDSIKGVITSAVDVAEEPVGFSVGQNAPNPFNPSTTISFTIPEAGTVSVDIFNVAGQKINTIVNEFMNTGSHSVTWDATGMSGGVYFYTVDAGEYSKTMKMTLLK